MLALSVTVLFVACAIASPILVKLGVLDPYTPHQDLLDFSTGGYPKGFGGGISIHHPLGVEPTLGRDVLSRLMYGTTLSLTIALPGRAHHGRDRDGPRHHRRLQRRHRRRRRRPDHRPDAVLPEHPDAARPLRRRGRPDAQGATSSGSVRTNVPNGPNGAFVNGFYIVIVLAIFGWPPIARLIRGQVLSIREREFVDAAILMGASRRRIYFKEILPNLWAPLLVYFTLLMPAYVSAEAALCYLGVGIKNPTPTLGNVLSGARPYAYADFVYFFAPAAIIAAIVISFNLLGDGARDALDPAGPAADARAAPLSLSAGKKRRSTARHPSEGENRWEPTGSGW